MINPTLPPSGSVGSSVDPNGNGLTGDPTPFPGWPEAGESYVPFRELTVSADQRAVAERLAQARPPERDDLELAKLYLGWQGTIQAPVLVNEPLPVGTIQTLNILNFDDITINPITVELLALSDHAYFWFDTSLTAAMPSPAAVAVVGEKFDRIYEQSVAIFGPENKPGVDGDPRLHVVTASPNAICNLSTARSSCGTAGYFSTFDRLPREVDPDSNGREMFVMNADMFGSPFYLNTLAHELRHMIEDNYDRGDADWETEGAAMLAEDLLGFPTTGVQRGNLFLKNPDQQLNSWTDASTLPYYGQGYLLNRYIYDRLGATLYQEFAASPETGLLALDGLAATNGLDLTGHSVWLDWLVALAIHDHPRAPQIYRLIVPGLNQVALTEVSLYPTTMAETVSQYAADYYHLLGDGLLNLEFDGTTDVPLLDVQPASGQWMWLANRANDSHMTLTRSVDLTGVEKATLQYQVNHDIETSYDFGYLFISEDGGQSWQPLLAPYMAGEDLDPAETTLADRFYTGLSEGWQAEQVDLSPYAGQEIMIRFVYLTDPILTEAGLALDNIAIPEIGFYDDAETPVDGWLAEGFDRVTGTLPQDWHLQLITFPDGEPIVTLLPLTPEQTLETSIDLSASGGQAILIIAASAPMTLEVAHYRLIIDQ